MKFPILKNAALIGLLIPVKRHFITFLFLALAIVLYSLGAAGPATGLLILGVMAEFVFWLRLFRGRKKQ